MAGRRLDAAARLVARLEMDRLCPGQSASYHTIYAYQLARRWSRAITDGLSDAVEPVFDADGKYLYFFASTDAGPVNQWFEQSAEDMRSRCVSSGDRRCWRSY